MLVTVMLREVAQQVRSDKNHNSKLHIYSVCMYTGREAGGSSILARGSSSVKVHRSIRAAAWERADYVKGTGEEG